MQKILIVVDMQNDFVDGALGTKEAAAVVPIVVGRVADAVRNGEKLYFTRDTHQPDYLNTKEGQKLPVPHCILSTKGWELIPRLEHYALGARIVDKPTFGSMALADILLSEHARDPIEKITLIGLCTDICVISNALLLKAALPEAEIAVNASCCAGVTPESHDNALKAMEMCQINIEREVL
ncbi:MAG: cysteine hydrolase [Lachnospiraceae bacterium]|nr:cysteine hydrolase [Lachnospiraceae bacterium]